MTNEIQEGNAVLGENVVIEGLDMQATAPQIDPRFSSEEARRDLAKVNEFLESIRESSPKTCLANALSAALETLQFESEEVKAAMVADIYAIKWTSNSVIKMLEVRDQETPPVLQECTDFIAATVFQLDQQMQKILTFAFDAQAVESINDDLEIQENEDIDQA